MKQALEITQKQGGVMRQHLSRSGQVEHQGIGLNMTLKLFRDYPMPQMGHFCGGNNTMDRSLVKHYKCPKLD